MHHLSFAACLSESGPQTQHTCGPLGITNHSVHVLALVQLHGSVPVSQPANQRHDLWLAISDAGHHATAFSPTCSRRAVGRQLCNLPVELHTSHMASTGAALVDYGVLGHINEVLAGRALQRSSAL